MPTFVPNQAYTTAGRELDAVENTTALLAQLTNALDAIMTSAYRVELGASKTIPTLIGTNLPLNLVKLIVVPEIDNTDCGHYAIGGVATSITPQIPAGGQSWPVTKAVADTISLFGQSGNYVQIQVYVPRS